MRWAISLLIVLAFAPSALAGDFDLLRGSIPVGYPSYTNWSGFYVGGQVGYSNENDDFSGATTPLVASSLIETTLEADAAPSQWPVLGRGSSSGAGFGGFAGYNSQWSNVILGIEANYTHSSITVTASQAPISDRLIYIGSSEYSVNVAGTGTLTVTDYGSLRARAGYILGDFLPYGFVGFVLGNGNYAITSQVYGQVSSATPTSLPCAPLSNTCVDYNFANSAVRNDTLMYGFSAGGGLDYSVTQNIFLRGEFEYVQFASVANVVASIITARVGAGFRF